MKFEIKNRYTGAIQLTIEGESFALALTAAVKAGANLYGADLYGANLYGANLRSADLRSANLYGADLYGANLRSADLRSADLRSANLYGADLYGANLGSADLRSADLRSADLRSANLYGADLYGANLRSANLRSANLYGADLYGADLYGADLGNFSIVPEEGDLIVYKKLRLGFIAKLKIPSEAKRVSSLVGRKCRAEFALVLSISKNGQEVQEGDSTHDKGETKYKVGEIVRPNSYDNDIRVECTSGIHFFITRKEAEEY